MQRSALSRTLSTIICTAIVLGFAVELSAQSPVDQPLLALQRGVTGVALYSVATIAIVFGAVRWMMGGGARHLAGIGGGLALAFFVREILSWLFHV